ncbi:MAG: hypothetical protein AAB500_00250 [Patescibacteria group bacterium]
MKLRHKKGFALIETLFAVSIFVLIVIALGMLARNIWIYSSYVSTGLSDSINGRRALKLMTAEIRTASTADTGVYTIAVASGNSFTFYSDIDGDVLKEKVRYFLAGANLQKGVTKPTGSPLSYNPANEVISTLIGNVTSANIFSYYDENYDGTTAALSFPVNIALIRLVKITFTTDKDPNREPAPSTFTTQVSIRNLKDNL